MKSRYLVVLALVAFLFQSTFMQFFRVDNIIPNLNLIIIVLLVINLDLKSSIVFSFTAGLLQDVFLAPYIGINVFLYILVSLVIINFEGVLNRVSLISPIVLVSVSTIIYNILFYLITLIMNLKFATYFFINVVIIEVVLNIIWGVILFWFSNIVFNKR